MTDPELVQRDELVLAVRRTTTTVAGLRDFYDAVYSEVARELAAQDVQVIGPAMGVYYRYDPAADVVDLAAGFPTSAPVAARDGVEPLVLAAGPVVRLDHVGSYDRLGDAHGRVIGFAADQGLALTTPFCETYVSEPAPDADPEAMLTVVEHPVG